MQSAYAHQVVSGESRAAVAQDARQYVGRTSVGEGSGGWAQRATVVASDKSRAEVRHNAIVAARAGDIANGEASFM